MSAKSPNLNNYAFIDGQNLYLGIKSQGWHYDYQRFRQYLADKFSVTKAYYFLGYLKTNQALYTKLQEAGYILVFKPILYVKGLVKGNIDSDLVFRAMLE